MTDVDQLTLLKPHWRSILQCTYQPQTWTLRVEVIGHVGHLQKCAKEVQPRPGLCWGSTQLTAASSVSLFCNLFARWQMITAGRPPKDGNRSETLEALSDTRWSGRAAATIQSQPASPSNADDQQLNFSAFPQRRRPSAESSPRPTGLAPAPPLG